MTSTMSALLVPFALAAALAPLASAQAVNGMDMSMDDGMTLASGMMMPYLHFTRGDILWFQGWVPQSSGALAGAGGSPLYGGMMEVRWREAARIRAVVDAKKNGKACDADNKGKKNLRLHAPPFIAAHDVMRGAIHAVQSLLGFAFMLAVMTFQASYIITLVLGLGIGEMLFGRYAAAGAGLH
ncbi:CTR copper uptake transporter [Mycena venus]|uniref:Copper transport protein n=1 Tax=Mycena venus TaxID=2733690 RepID=A0A8H6Y8M6_9AGAR|nr:CTR copper uptake transporter [Mycena venus]